MMSNSAMTIDLRPVQKSGILGGNSHSGMSFYLSSSLADVNLVKKAWDKGDTKAKTAATPRTLAAYISLHLKINAFGLALSMAAFVCAIVLGNLAAIAISSIVVLVFLDMLITVAVDKRHSLRNGSIRRPR